MLSSVFAYCNFSSDVFLFSFLILHFHTNQVAENITLQHKNFKNTMASLIAVLWGCVGAESILLGSIFAFSFAQVLSSDSISVHASLDDKSPRSACMLGPCFGMCFYAKPGSGSIKPTAYFNSVYILFSPF